MSASATATKRIHKATKIRRIGVVAGGPLYLAACDLGEAVLDDGRTVTITWGRNLEGTELDWYLARTSLDFVGTGSACELVLDDKTAESLRSILVEHIAHWVDL